MFIFVDMKVSYIVESLAQRMLCRPGIYTLDYMNFIFIFGIFRI